MERGGRINTEDSLISAGIAEARKNVPICTSLRLNQIDILTPLCFILENGTLQVNKGFTRNKETKLPIFCFSV